MESFIHLRKGKTPRRLHADLDGLKDDELGRGGFTGRTANMYRRNDPTAYRSEGPLRPLDVLSSELKPSDATDADGGPLLMFTNSDCRISLSRRHAADAVLRPPRRRRSAVLRAPGDRSAGDRIRAAALPRRRLGVSAQGMHLASGPRCRDDVADDRGQRRVPRSATGFAGPALPVRPLAGRHPRTRADRRRRPRRVPRPADPRGRPDNAFLSTQSARRRRLARRQLRVHLQHRRLQRGDLRQRPPTPDRAPVHASHRRLRDELPAQARRRRAGHRAHTVVSPQRRLRRDRLLPRRFAVRHSRCRPA